MISKNNIGSIDHNNSNSNMVIILITIITRNSKVRLKLMKLWLNRSIFYKQGQTKQAVPIIYTMQPLGKIKNANIITPILYTKGAIAVSGSRQNVSCLKRSEGFVYECYGNIKETSVLAYIA